MEILTIRRKAIPHLSCDVTDPLLLLQELKMMVKDLKKNNPCLEDYRLVDVGFTSTFNNQKISYMSLYFKRS